MKLTIQSTDDVQTIGDTECRRWHGITEGGAECELFVHRIQVPEDADLSEFEQLEEQPAPMDPPMTDAEAERHIERAKKELRERVPPETIEESGMHALLLGFFSGRLRAACDQFLLNMHQTGREDRREVQMMGQYVAVLRHLVPEKSEPLSAPPAEA